MYIYISTLGPFLVHCGGSDDDPSVPECGGATSGICTVGGNGSGSSGGKDCGRNSANGGNGPKMAAVVAVAAAVVAVAAAAAAVTFQPKSDCATARR